MSYLARNNGASTLAVAVPITGSGRTSVTVQTGHGERYPVVNQGGSGTDYTLVTLENGATREIICIVRRDSESDTMTVGIPGSAAANIAGRNFEAIYQMVETTFAIGSVVSCRATAAIIAAATGKTTPVDADEMSLIDTAASWRLKRLTWANLKATLLTYFSALTSTWAISTTGNAATSTTATNLSGGSVNGTTGTFSGAVSSSSPTGGIGYAVGAGGAAGPYSWNNVGGGTINKISGEITFNSQSLTAGTIYYFSINNSTVAAEDVVLLTTDTPYVFATACIIAAGGFYISMFVQQNTTAQVDVNFAVIKAVST